jgi:hypothetical protein
MHVSTATTYIKIHHASEFTSRLRRSMFLRRMFKTRCSYADSLTVAGVIRGRRAAGLICFLATLLADFPFGSAFLVPVATAFFIFLVDVLGSGGFE